MSFIVTAELQECIITTLSSARRSAQVVCRQLELKDSSHQSCELKQHEHDLSWSMTLFCWADCHQISLSRKTHFLLLSCCSLWDELAQSASWWSWLQLWWHFFWSQLEDLSFSFFAVPLTHSIEPAASCCWHTSLQETWHTVTWLMLMLVTLAWLLKAMTVWDVTVMMVNADAKQNWIKSRIEHIFTRCVTAAVVVRKREWWGKIFNWWGSCCQSLLMMRRQIVNEWWTDQFRRDVAALASWMRWRWKRLDGISLCDEKFNDLCKISLITDGQSASWKLIMSSVLSIRERGGGEDLCVRLRHNDFSLFWLVPLVLSR